MRGRAVILATGSAPKSIPGFDVDGERLITSDHATHLPTLPERLAVLGGGVIGVEFASVFTDMGVQTHLLEALPGGVLPIGPDPDAAKVLARALSKRGVVVHGDAMVKPPVGHRRRTAGVVRHAEGRPADRGRPGPRRRRPPAGDGRARAWPRPAWPWTPAASSRSIGPRCGRRGTASTPSATSSTHLGLAHVAYAEAIVAITGHPGRTAECPSTTSGCRGSCTPIPEVAWVGLTEEQARRGRPRRRGGAGSLRRRTGER